MTSRRYQTAMFCGLQNDQETENMNIHRLNSYPQRSESPRSSPRAEVGEIDTRAPFQSVKAAVSLFGEVALSKDRRMGTPRKSRLSSESVIDKETQLLLSQKELNSIRQKLDSADTTKAKALADLERAKRTVQDLTVKLTAAKDSKMAAVQATEALNEKGDHLAKADTNTEKPELDVAREQYIASAAELDSAKQALNKVRQDFDAALEAKSLASQQAAEAERSTKVQSEKAAEVAKEIAAIKEAIHEVGFATQQAKEEHEEIVAEKEEVKKGYLSAKTELTEKLEALDKDYDPELVASLEKKLAETSAEVESVQEEMKKAHASEMDSVRVVTTELNVATKTMQEVAEQESSLRRLVNSLRVELEDVKREQAEIKMKEAEREAIAIQNASDAIDENAARLQQLSNEAEAARKEAERITREVQHLKQEAEAAQAEMEEMTNRLEGLLTQAEQAKLAEKAAVDRMKEVSNGGSSESAGKLNVSKEELDSLTKKQEECSNTANIKVAAATTALEAINVNKNEANKKLEAALKAIEEIKEATEMALRSVEMSETAQKAVECELRKWKEGHQTVAA